MDNGDLNKAELLATVQSAYMGKLDELLHDGKIDLISYGQFAKARIIVMTTGGSIDGVVFDLQESAGIFD
jgi:hypothetical protein